MRVVCRSGQASKRKFEVYVCTAADRPWALEAWRLLDPHGDLIPHDQRPRRLFSMKVSKDLAQVLNIGRLPHIHGEPRSVYDRFMLGSSETMRESFASSVAAYASMTKLMRRLPQYASRGALQGETDRTCRWPSLWTTVSRWVFVPSMLQYMKTCAAIFSCAARLPTLPDRDRCSSHVDAEYRRSWPFARAPGR